MSRIRYSSFFSAILLASILLAWIVFLPVQFGGAAAFVIVDGNSMEPTYQRGDLVITRTETSYQVGDIVTYNNKDLNRPVIHRIIGEEKGRFILQGDNNPWLDHDRPSTQDIIGKAWIHLPGVGTWLAYIQTPLGIALLSGIAVFFILAMYTLGDRRYRAFRTKWLSGTRRIQVNTQFEQGAATMTKIGRQLNALIYAFVIIFSVSLVLAYVSFSRPETLSNLTDTEYIHIGLFSYSAPALPGVYDPAGPQTGDPIFLKTTCQVTVRFDYFLTADILANVQGTISLRAETRDVNGWKRTFPLTESIPFEGKSASAQATLNPCQILATLRSAEEKTQLQRGVYRLDLVPEVTLTNAETDQPFSSTFSPVLEFVLDEYQLYISNPDPDNGPLFPFKKESRASAYNIPNRILLPGFSLTVSLGRLLSLLGIAVSLGMGGYLAWSVQAEMKKDPALAILLRYGNLLVNVRQVSFDLRSKEIIVYSINDLVNMAERNATAIMRLEQENWQDFIVEGNSVIYRYRLPRRKDGQ